MVHSIFRILNEKILSVVAKKWSSYLKHPLSIGFILSVVVVFLLARYLPQYYTELIEKTLLTNQGKVYYADLDNDGNSEKLNYYQYDRIFQPTLYLYNAEDNFRFLWNFTESQVENTNIFTGDFNEDSIEEIFIFTGLADSLFLYVLNSENDKDYFVKREFITTGNIDKAQIIPIGLYHLNHSKTKEFVFAFNGGNSHASRRIYAFDMAQKHIYTSPELNVNIKLPIVVQDINFDQQPEIILSNASIEPNGNNFESQLIVLNSELDYFFQPVVFHGGPSQVTTSVVKVDNENVIAVLNSGKNKENIYNNLMLYNASGKKLNESIINNKTNLKIIQLSDSENIYLNSEHKVIRYTTDLKKDKTYRISKAAKSELIDIVDIFGDAGKEIVFKTKSGLVILSENLRSRLNLNVNTDGSVIMTVLRNKQKTNKLSIQVNDKLYLFNFYKNESFFYSHIFYFLLLFLINALVFIIYKLSFINLKKVFKGKSENDFLMELEDNIEDHIEEKFVGLKSKIEELSNELHGDSYSKIIREVDQTMKLVKTVSTSKQNKNANLNDRLNKLIRKLPNAQNISLYIYPDNFTQQLKKEIQQALICFANQCLSTLSGIVESNSVDIQIVFHNDYLNVIIEIENMLITHDQLTVNNAITETLEKVDGKIEIDHYSSSGTIISANIPLTHKKENQKQASKIKIIIAEDHDVSLFGLVSLFKTKEDIELVGTAKNGMEVLKILEYKDTDIVITDISMPGMDGIELSEQLQKEYPNIKVIVFTMYLENWFVEQLVTNGAKGFVSKNSKITELISAVRNVYEGSNYYCPQFKSKFGFKSDQNGVDKDLNSLTKNELQIIRYYAENFTKDQIAIQMKVNGRTIDNFIANILLKLNAGDEQEIIRIAKKQKFITD